MTNIFKILQKGGLPASIRPELIDTSNPNNVLPREERHGKFRYNNKVIYPIGDIHGDVMLLKHILLDLTKACISEETLDNRTDRLDNISWNPESTDILVFCGDLIDIARNNDPLTNLLEYNEYTDQLILYHLIRLSHEARRNNGRIYIILGNHEVAMNFNMDQNINRYKHPKINTRTLINERTRDFGNGMFLNFIINNTFSMIIINNHLFLHGGITTKFINYITYTIRERNNARLSERVRTDLNNIYENNLIDGNINYIGFINDLYRLFIYNYSYSIQDGILMIRNGQSESLLGTTFWNRTFGFNDTGNPQNGDKTISCHLRIDELNHMSSSFNLGDDLHIVVGHCVQNMTSNNFSINYCCNNRVLRIDAGMSIGFSFNFYKFYSTILLQARSDPRELIPYINLLTNHTRNISVFNTQIVRLIFNNDYSLVNANIIYGIKSDYLQIGNNKNDMILSEFPYANIIRQYSVKYPEFCRIYTNYYDESLKFKNLIFCNLKTNLLTISNITTTNNENIVINPPKIFNYKHFFSNRFDIGVLQFLMCETKYRS